MLLRVRREARIDHWSIYQKLSELSSEFCFIKMYHFLIWVTKIIRYTFQPCGCPHFVKLCEGGELSVLPHTVPCVWKTLRKDLLHGTRLFYKLIWFPSVLAFCTLDLSELHLPPGSAWLAPPLHQQEPDPLSTYMFPSSDNWPSLPACPPVPSKDCGFPFMEEQKTAAWGHMGPLHLPTAHGQTPASKAASAVSLSEEGCIQAISICAVEYSTQQFAVHFYIIISI